MTISALVVGFGSIGKRHLEILENFSIIDNLAVFFLVYATQQSFFHIYYIS